MIALMSVWAVILPCGVCPGSPPGHGLEPAVYYKQALYAVPQSRSATLPKGSVARLGSLSNDPVGHALYAVAFAPDGKSIATGCDCGLVTLWDAASGKTICVFRGHTRGVPCVGFSPDGKSLASAGYDGTI